MSLISLEEAKIYLRVDSSDEDALIGTLLRSAEILCVDVSRLTDEEWEAIESEDTDTERGIIPTTKLKHRRELMRVAILYTLGYLFEHREEADHHGLLLTLRSILFSIREGVV